MNYEYLNTLLERLEYLSNNFSQFTKIPLTEFKTTLMKKATEQS